MKIVIPTTCPCCDSTLERVNDQLFCRNIECSAQTVGKLTHFAKNMGIKGLGEKTIEKLGLSSIIDLYYLDSTEAEEVLGSKIAVKLLDEIERSKQATFATVIASMSIPLVGNTIANKLSSANINSFSELTRESCKEAGLGDKATTNLLEWLNYEYQELKDFLPFEFKQKQIVAQSNSSNGTICITGKLSSFKTKAEAKSVLESLGYIVVDTLTKAVTILVDESGKGSSKRTVAEERGIQIVTDLSQFIKS